MGRKNALKRQIFQLSFKDPKPKKNKLVWTEAEKGYKERTGRLTLGRKSSVWWQSYIFQTPAPRTISVWSFTASYNETILGTGLKKTGGNWRCARFSWTSAVYFNLATGQKAGHYGWGSSFLCPQWTLGTAWGVRQRNVFATLEKYRKRKFHPLAPNVHALGRKRILKSREILLG